MRVGDRRGNARHGWDQIRPRGRRPRPASGPHARRRAPRHRHGSRAWPRSRRRGRPRRPRPGSRRRAGPARGHPGDREGVVEDGGFGLGRRPRPRRPRRRRARRDPRSRRGARAARRPSSRRRRGVTPASRSGPARPGRPDRPESREASSASSSLREAGTRGRRAQRARTYLRRSGAQVGQRSGSRPRAEAAVVAISARSAAPPSSVDLRGRAAQLRAQPRGRRLELEQRAERVQQDGPRPQATHSHSANGMVSPTSSTALTIAVGRCQPRSVAHVASHMWSGNATAR